MDFFFGMLVVRVQKTLDHDHFRLKLNGVLDDNYLLNGERLSLSPNVRIML